MFFRLRSDQGRDHHGNGRVIEWCIPLVKRGRSPAHSKTRSDSSCPKTTYGLKERPHSGALPTRLVFPGKQSC